MQKDGRYRGGKLKGGEGVEATREKRLVEGTEAESGRKRRNEEATFTTAFRLRGVGIPRASSGIWKTMPCIREARRRRREVEGRLNGGGSAG